MILESYCYSSNSFVTLTYNDECLPKDGSVHFDHLRKFVNNLRSRLKGRRFRYFGVGEYGDKSERPHYHLILFGVDHIGDSEAIGKSWRLNRVQPGFVDIGTVNKDSIQYVCGYTIKKMTKEDDPRLHGRNPEFSIQSRHPGIGVPALPEIAKLINGPNGHMFLTEDGDVPISLYHGSRKLPLGRLLRAKLRDLVGLEEVYDKETGEVFYRAKILQEIRQTEEMFQMYEDAQNDPKTTKEAVSLKRAFVEKHRQEILNIETKHKLFQKDKAL